MKQSLFILSLILCSLVLRAQKTDYVWVMEGDCINFNTNPPVVTSSPNLGNYYNLCCLSDYEGNLLFTYTGNKLYDSKNGLIKTNRGGLSHTTALVPCPYNNGISLFFHQDESKFRYGVLDNATNQYTFKAFLPYIYYTFVGKKGSEDIWLIATNNKTDKLEISLITKDGITRTTEYNNSLKIYGAEVSVDGSMIFNEKKLYAFDNENGILGDVIFETESFDCVFSKSGKYLYSYIPSENDSKISSLVRYDLEMLDSKKTVCEVLEKEIPTPKDIKLGPNGKIYLLMGKTISALNNVDSQEPKYESDVIKLSGNADFFPFTFRYSSTKPPATPPSGSMSVCLNSSTDYFIDNPVEGSKYVWNISPSAMGEVVSNSESYDKISVRWKNVGDAEISVYEVNSSGCNSDASSIEVKVWESPDAQFDNASLCYGEPLNVILRGVATFTLDYTLDGESFSVPDISTDIYKMPDTPGKYSILKVSDKNCTSVPEKNNNAVIGKEMKPLKIKIGE